MDILQYCGAMKSRQPANKFVTSIFTDQEGNYFSQQVEQEKIISFTKLDFMCRELIPAKTEIHVKLGDPAIYTYLYHPGKDAAGNDPASEMQLLFGCRRDLEQLLLPFIYSSLINVHAKLILSSFLNLYQRTIDLVEESNCNLQLNGVEQVISKDIVFTSATVAFDNADDPLQEIADRYNRFLDIVEDVRPQDIVFLTTRNAFFFNYKISIDSVVNKRCLEKEDHRKIVSELIMFCAKTDDTLLQSMIASKSESYDFLLQSDYLILEQYDIEKLLSDRIWHDEFKLDENLSVLTIGIDMDKDVHANEVEDLDSEWLEDFEKTFLAKSKKSIIARTSPNY